jgi:hypothetical protein
MSTESALEGTRMPITLLPDDLRFADRFAHDTSRSALLVQLGSGTYQVPPAYGYSATTLSGSGGSHDAASKITRLVGSKADVTPLAVYIRRLAPRGFVLRDSDVTAILEGQRVPDKPFPTVDVEVSPGVEYGSALYELRRKREARSEQLAVWMRRHEHEVAARRNDSESKTTEVGATGGWSLTGTLMGYLGRSKSTTTTRNSSRESDLLRQVEAWEYLIEKSEALCGRIDDLMRPAHNLEAPLSEPDARSALALVHELRTLVDACALAK